MPNIPRILVVEPNRESRTSLHVRGSRYGLVESFANFESARARIMAGGFDYLVTNIRLEAFNGLHLVYLSRSLGVSACALAYTEVPDNSLAADAHAAGAAYCAFEHVLRALADDLLGDAESGNAGIGHDSAA
jgi:DNA-binding NtrC family response regulator